MATEYRSPLLSRPGAVSGDGRDAAVPAHYGSWNVEQRRLVEQGGWVDLSHHDVVRVTGADRLTWLHQLTSNHVEHLAPGDWMWNAILSPNGHLEQLFLLTDDGASTYLVTEPGTGEGLSAFLLRMRFWTEVEIDLAPLALVWAVSEGVESYRLVERDQLVALAEATAPAGMLAHEALRIARGEPRLGLDTDERTLPNEVGLLLGDEGSPIEAVVVDKGCYRGQETVARTWNLGKPPRRLVRLLLDGSVDRLPAHGTEVRLVEQTPEGSSVETTVGFIGSAARHHELGPIALALVKRSVPVDAELGADGIPASQEIVVDPEVGLHFRAKEALGVTPGARRSLL